MPATLSHCCCFFFLGRGVTASQCVSMTSGRLHSNVRFFCLHFLLPVRMYAVKFTFFRMSKVVNVWTNIWSSILKGWAFGMSNGTCRCFFNCWSGPMFNTNRIQGDQSFLSLEVFVTVNKNPPPPSFQVETINYSIGMFTLLPFPIFYPVLYSFWGLCSFTLFFLSPLFSSLLFPFLVVYHA